MFELVEGVGAVGVATQHDRRPAAANRLEHVDVPTGLDLHLDAAVPGLQLGLDFFEQLRDGILNADGNPASNLPLRAPQQFPKRLLLLLSLGVPERVLDSSLGHTMASNLSHPRHAL